VPGYVPKKVPACSGKVLGGAAKAPKKKCPEKFWKSLEKLRKRFRKLFQKFSSTARYAELCPGTTVASFS